MPRQAAWWENLLNYVVRPLTDVWSVGSAEFGWKHFNDWQKNQDQQYEQQQDVYDRLESGQLDPTSAQGEIAKSGYGMSADFEKYLDNLIAQQNTQSARAWEQQMASSDLLRAGEQLKQLGLSPSNVVSTGGSGVNAVGSAPIVHSNVAQNRYNQQMALARSILSMTSSMASAGIYGSALGSAKKAASTIASSAAHSGLAALKKTKHVNRSLTPAESAEWNRMVASIEAMNPGSNPDDLPF